MEILRYLRPRFFSLFVLASDDPDLWIAFMNFDIDDKNRDGPGCNFVSMMEKNDGFSGSIMAPETMMNDDVDEMSMKIPVMGIIIMKVIFVLLSMKRISLQEISGSSTSMMEEKTMDIKDTFSTRFQTVSANQCRCEQAKIGF